MFVFESIRISHLTKRGITEVISFNNYWSGNTVIESSRSPTLFSSLPSKFKFLINIWSQGTYDIHELIAYEGIFMM